MIGYGYYLKDKEGAYSKIEQGVCPNCKKEGIELIDIKGLGCSPKTLTFKCNNCGYEDSFTQKNSGCSL